MNKIKLLSIVLAVGILFAQCGDDCDPGPVEPDVFIVVNLKKNGRSLQKVVNNGMVPDSVKYYNNVTNNLLVPVYLNDSVLIIGDYTKTAGSNTPASIRVVAGNLPADIISFTSNSFSYPNRCGTTFIKFFPSDIKLNNALLMSQNGFVEINK
jgi:hypothetical protein